MTAPSERDRWIRNFRPAPTARMRLVCFPHAGGSASYFFPLAAALSPEFDVHAVQYPGRQDRYTEPLVDNIDDMADRAFAAVEPLTDAPVALFGHSMGAVLAFEVARRIETLAGRAPVLVFASGSRAPSRYGDERKVKRRRRLPRSDARPGRNRPAVAERPRHAGHVPAGVPQRLPRAAAYRRGTEVGIDAPIVVMVATDDVKTSLADARAWHEHTSGGGELHTFEGGHFYLEKQPQRVIEVIAQTLRATEDL